MRRDVTLHADEKLFPFGDVTTPKIIQIALFGDFSRRVFY